MPVAVTDDVGRAVRALREGGLVAVPTETVYGLGAAAGQPAAVARVYAVKGRPADHPLIVHLAAAQQLRGWAARIPSYAEALADACWPGPLTLVLPKLPSVGRYVTGGQDTVALRVPDHPVALVLLQRFGSGVAAPSANRFGRVSPTSAAHVLAELGPLLDPQRDVVLDGGPARVGLESTIVDCTGDRPRLLRPGAVTAAQIRDITGLELATDAAKVRAPGTLAAHYAPRAEVLIVADPGPSAPPQLDPQVGLIAPAAAPTPIGVVRLLAPPDLPAYAAGLYAAMREADELRLREVRVVLPTGDGLAAAIADRVQRAAVGSAQS